MRALSLTVHTTTGKPAAWREVTLKISLEAGSSPDPVGGLARLSTTVALLLSLSMTCQGEQTGTFEFFFSRVLPVFFSRGSAVSSPVLAVSSSAVSAVASGVSTVFFSGVSAVFFSRVWVVFCCRA
jgi:hypothetical protein